MKNPVWQQWIRYFASLFSTISQFFSIYNKWIWCSSNRKRCRMGEICDTSGLETLGKTAGTNLKAWKCRVDSQEVKSVAFIIGLLGVVQRSRVFGEMSKWLMPVMYKSFSIAHSPGFFWLLQVVIVWRCGKVRSYRLAYGGSEKGASARWSGGIKSEKGVGNAEYPGKFTCTLCSNVG